MKYHQNIILRVIWIFLFTLTFLSIHAQKEISNFIFGHSLIHHEFQVNPTPSQETSLPHWIHFLSAEAGHQYRVSGQYGFLPQHDNLPPFAQWGFDFVDSAWDSDYESFSEADFNTILITPGNFIQWQSPLLNYPGETVSPIGATQTIFEWCNQQEADLNFYIYENWPDMAPFLSNGFPPSENEWNSYNENLNTEFRDWFREYCIGVKQSFPNSCIKLIPVGSLISQLLSTSPFDDIAISDLYEDDAPHGRPTIYFLAALISYMTIYEEKAPLSYEVEAIIHPLIAEQYEEIVEIFWSKLQTLIESNGESMVFCKQPIVSTLLTLDNKPTSIISPNPTHHSITIETPIETSLINIVDLHGKVMLKTATDTGGSSTIDISHFPKGVYILQTFDDRNIRTYQNKIIKL